MEHGKPEVYVDIGRRVRDKRMLLGWTLDELAAVSGVSRRMVVNVEQGTVNASIGTLLRLSDALGIGIPSLVAPDSAEALSLTRHGEGPELWRSPGGGRAILLAGTSPPDVLELWEWILAPGDRHDSEAHSRGTREIAHVREGTARIEAAGLVTDLSVGDALVFNSDVEHSYSNLGSTLARFTLVVLEPNVRTEEESHG